MNAFALVEMNTMWVNGIPITMWGYSAAKLNQKMSWTRTGVPRKNQM